MKALRAFGALEPLVVCLPMCSGLQIPSKGVRRGTESGVLLRLASVQGDVSWQRALDVQPVGACYVQVRWGTPALGSITDLTLSLQCAMPIAAGERVEISMKGIALESISADMNAEVQLAGVVQKIVTNSSSETHTSTPSRRLLFHEPEPLFKPARVLWSQGPTNMSNALVLESTGIWNPDEHRSFLIPPELGLRVPAVLRAGHLSYSVNAAAGPGKLLSEDMKGDEQGVLCLGQGGPGDAMLKRVRDNTLAPMRKGNPDCRLCWLA